VDNVVWYVGFRIFGTSPEVETYDQIKCAKRQLSLPAELRVLNVPSPRIDIEHAHYASFNASLIIDCESESLGPLYGIIRREVRNVATSTSPWAVQLRASYATISGTCGFSDVDLAVFATTLDQDLTDYVSPDVKIISSFASSFASSPSALALHIICLQVPTPYALSRPSDTKGHLKRGMSRTFKSRVFFISWLSMVLHPRIMCVLFQEPAVGLWLYFLLRMNLASASPLDSLQPEPSNFSRLCAVWLCMLLVFSSHHLPKFSVLISFSCNPNKFAKA
jgi:hypothetical protein